MVSVRGHVKEGDMERLVATDHIGIHDVDVLETLDEAAGLLLLPARGE